MQVSVFLHTTAAKGVDAYGVLQVTAAKSYSIQTENTSSRQFPDSHLWNWDQPHHKHNSNPMSHCLESLVAVFFN